MKSLTATLVLAVVTLPRLFGQGPLAPLAAPGPLMKSLDQIEPRTPISSLPFVISTSGSYYFTQNLQFTAVSGGAITINASNVTLDLGGFTLSSTAAVTGRAINIGIHANITVKNGTIAGNTTVAITGTAHSRTWTVTPAGFEMGIVDFSTSCHYQDLSIRGCRVYGLINSGGGGTTLNKVAVSANGNHGISCEFGSISNCVATSNGAIGIHAYSGSITNSTSSYNGESGVYSLYGTISNTSAASNRTYGIFATSGSVNHATATSNSGIGIYADSGSVTNCTATSNGSNGISANSGSVTNSTARSNVATDLVASAAVVAFCKAGSMAVTGTLTGNLTP